MYFSYDSIDRSNAALKRNEAKKEDKKKSEDNRGEDRDRSSTIVFQRRQAFSRRRQLTTRNPDTWDSRGNENREKDPLFLSASLSFSRGIGGYDTMDDRRWKKIKRAEKKRERERAWEKKRKRKKESVGSRPSLSDCRKWHRRTGKRFIAELTRQSARLYRARFRAVCLNGNGIRIGAHLPK